MGNGATVLNPGVTAAGTGVDAAAAAAAAVAGGGAGAGGDWMTSLPDEIKNDPSLKLFQNDKGIDMAALTKSYVNAQKMIGADKVVVPGKNSTPEEWKSFFMKAGLPESVDKYELALPQDAKVDPNMLKGFKDLAHKAGILPSQAEQLVAWFQGEQTNGMKAYQDSQVAQVEKGLTDLKAEWGQGYDKKVQQAHLAVREFGDEKLGEYLDKTGIGNDPQLIRLFAKIGESLGEDKLKGANGAQNFGKTPDEASREINQIMGDAKGAYWDAGHPGHKDAVQNVLRLRGMMTGAAS